MLLAYFVSFCFGLQCYAGETSQLALYDVFGWPTHEYSHFFSVSANSKDQETLPYFC